MNWILVGVAAYIFVQFAIGIAVSRKVQTESDYLVAGRQLGLVVASFSVFATWFGAETIIGAAGSIYADGLAGGSSDPFGYVLCIVLMGLLFARPLWRRGYTTFADLFRERYSPGVERLVVCLLVPPSVIWAAAQIRAFGQVLSSITDLEVEWAITAATCLVIAYTAFGGMLADAWTDLVQGLSLVAGLLLIGGSIAWHTPDTVLSQSFSAERLALVHWSEKPWYLIAEEWAIPILGSVFAVELISRVLACRTAETARSACLLGASIYLLMGLVPVGVGLIGPHLHPNLDEPEQLMPLVAQSHLGSTFFVVFAGTLISAILSTVDSALLAASALIAHNLIGHQLPQLSDRTRMNLARVGVAILGLCAYGLALHSQTVDELVEHASAFGSSGVVVVACFGLATRWGGPWSAYAACMAGLATWAWGEYGELWPTPYLLSVVAAFMAYVVVAICEPWWPVFASSSPQAERSTDDLGLG